MVTMSMQSLITIGCLMTKPQCFENLITTARR